MRKWIVFVALALLVGALLLLLLQRNGEERVEDFYMTARLTAIAQRLEVEVTESGNGMIGPFWVITPPETAYLTADGRRLSHRELQVGSLLHIRFGGQVMMSYPPQIVASEISVLEG